MEREELIEIATEMLTNLTQEDRNNLWTWMIEMKSMKAENQKRNGGNRSPA